MIERTSKLLKPKDLIVEDKLEASKTVGGRAVQSVAEPSARSRLTGDDWLGAFGIFGLVFFSTLPVVLPFILVSRPGLALRVSNLVAIGLLFLTGYLFGRNTGHNPWRLGIAMVLIGCLLTGVAISLGG
jgi:VIT1/CCC1 family predicted Fe2+/Mn2+ transporter